MTSATDNRTTELLPCPWCGVDMKLHAINYPWADGDPGWSIWHEDMGEAGKRKCPMEMGCYDTKEEAIAAWNTRATRGTLTADDVRDLIERHSDASGGNGRDFHNGAYKAIADELNARAERTCECGWRGFVDGWGYERPNYCPRCGGKVVSE